MHYIDTMTRIPITDRYLVGGHLAVLASICVYAQKREQSISGPKSVVNNNFL